MLRFAELYFEYLHQVFLPFMKKCVTFNDIIVRNVVSDVLLSWWINCSFRAVMIKVMTQMTRFHKLVLMNEYAGSIWILVAEKS